MMEQIPPLKSEASFQDMIPIKTKKIGNSLILVFDQVRHESTRVNTSPTRINTSQHKSKTSNDFPEAATRGVVCKKLFLEISQNS